MIYLLGIDIGTTSLKTALFDEKGKMLKVSTKEYSLVTPSAEEVELDPDLYWQACKEAISELTADMDTRQIKAIGVDSQGETLIVVDNQGNALRPAIVWLDNRSREETEEIEKQFGTKQTFRITGQPDIIPTWTATKILWLRKKEPEVFRKAHKYILVKDYIIYKLTGRFTTDSSILSSTLMFDISKNEWWDEMLEFLGLSSEQLPEIIEPGQVAGKITEEARAQTGLAADAVVVAAGMDQTAGMIGSGNILPGVITETTGAALAVCATVDKPTINTRFPIPCQCHSVKGKYVLLAWCPTAGMALKWFRDQFCRKEQEEAQQQNIEVYDILGKLASQVAPGCEGLLMLPHLAGAGSPEFNPQAKGVYFGFTLKHTKAHFIRALMEAVAFMVKSNVEILEKLGLDIKEIRGLGGGAKSRLWNSIKADVMAKPVVTLENEEAACLGSAILAGVAIGLYPSLEAACSLMVKTKETFSPTTKNRKVYQEVYSKYLSLYETLKAIF